MRRSEFRNHLSLQSSRKGEENIRKRRKIQAPKEQSGNMYTWQGQYTFCLS